MDSPAFFCGEREPSEAEEGEKNVDKRPENGYNRTMESSSRRPQLPEEFVKAQRALLGEGFADYLEALSRPPVRGLTVNRLKISPEDFAARAPFPLRPAPVEGGFELTGGQNFGLHPFHAAGLFYLQEPSAMCAADLLRGRTGKRVLDLCAAPGGKTAQLLSMLPEDGILLSNEPVPDRARILVQNLERLGAARVMVTCLSPARLAAALPGFFDAVVADVPCSGEGMFRKDPDAARYWTPKAVESCARRQREILASAAELVAPGGFLVYSTCTFNRTENEGVLEAFLASNPSFSPVDLPLLPGLLAGDLPGSRRALPHLFPGEGQFACLLQRQEEEETSAPAPALPFEPLTRREEAALRAALGDWVDALPEGDFRRRGDCFFLTPLFPPVPALTAGVALAVAEKNRLEPHHHLTHVLPLSRWHRALSLPLGHPDLARYLAGEALSEDPAADLRPGFGVLAVERFPLGGFKAAGGALKNRFPKGLRFRMPF